MDYQYKLYILDKKKQEETLSKLYEVFPKKQINLINSNNIAVEYDYIENDYKSILEKMSKFKVTQNIITTSKFITILLTCIKKDILIENIRLFELLREENDILEKYINKINYDNGSREKYIGLLLDELEYLNYDEGIDIKSMSFKIKSISKPVLINFTIHDNGVILIGNQEILDEVIGILQSI